MRLALATALAWTSSCTPDLGDVPFACDTGDVCPDGYSCQSTVCVRDGVFLPVSRPMRVVWINSAEMYWFASPNGGASLVVNDGFTPGAHGIYEIVVSPEGLATPPRALIAYGDEFPMSSALVALDDERYGVATLSFPNVGEDVLRLTVRAAPREASGGTTSEVETLYTEEQAYLGGTEPAYIGAVADTGTLDVAFARPSGGGSVMVTHLEQSGSAWSATRTTTKALPPDVLPLSGDCLLWRSAGGGLTLRVGFESFAVLPIDAEGNAAEAWVSFDDVPLYAWGEEVLLLRYGAESQGSYAASYVVSDLDGDETGEEAAGWIQGALEPYTATPYGDGAVFAPLSKDRAFSRLEVGYRSPTEGLLRLASIPRQSRDEIYSARAIVSGDKVYLAWTEFHEALMDLWVAVGDLEASP